MIMLKVILLVLIISTTFADARARRRRRQLSSASYYISDINPYSNSYSPTAPLTYPSGSYYNGPNYGYQNMGVTGDQPMYSADNSGVQNQYGAGYPSNYNNNNQYPFGTNQNYQLPNLGSTYGSGLYGAYGTLSYGYAPVGFNNQYPNWQQGNIAQYYTGGTGSGLSNPGFQWYRKFRNVPFQGQLNENFNRKPMGPNPQLPMGNQVMPNVRVKRRVRSNLQI
ncbi:unnamed protein product [Rotaria magnacalcarata]|uniref:Uncharacterized protein n=4 Tax=Rotaria magnacalcarata TaxID=392030 RepID=A0A816EMJ2_9BILA|nr:unnamed protein product [Rotaria magnacalcarata]